MRGNEVTQPTKNGITGTTIKIIALISMAIDHFTVFILEGYIKTLDPQYATLGSKSPNLNYDDGTMQLQIVISILHLIGRLAFPLFIFLLIEGFKHTGNIRKYATRLFAFALISQLPYNLMHGGLLHFEKLNIFSTLFMGLLCIYCINELAEKRQWSDKLIPLYYISSILLGAYLVWLFLQNKSIPATRQVPVTQVLILAAVAGVMALIIMIRMGLRLDSGAKNRFTFTVLPIIVFGVISNFIKVEYGVYGVMAIVVMYLFYKNKVRGYVLSVVTLTVYIFNELAAVLAIPLIDRYNGERGMKINKYFFYIFYPAHILILYLIALALGFTTFSLF